MKNFHTFRPLTNKQAERASGTNGKPPQPNQHQYQVSGLQLKKKDSSGIVIFPNFWCENFFHFSVQKPVAM